MNIPGKIRLVNAAPRFGKPEWETLIRRTKTRGWLWTGSPAPSASRLWVSPGVLSS